MELKFIIPITGNQEVKFSEIGTYLKPYLHPETHIQFTNLVKGFSSVETELAGMFNGTEVVMDIYRKNSTDFHGVFIDCFDDPGVYACREIGKFPVIGPYQAAISTALSLAERIGIITTDEAGILNEEKKARSMGLENRIVSVQAVDLPVAGIRDEKEKVLSDLEELCKKMVNQDRVSAICLGCTAMFYVSDELKSRLYKNGIRVNIIEPILNGVLTLENIVRMGYNNFVPGEVDFSMLEWE